MEREDSSPTKISSEHYATPENNVNDISSRKSKHRTTKLELDYLSFPLFIVCITHTHKNEDKNEVKNNDEYFQRRGCITTLASCSFEDSSDCDSLHSFCTCASESEDDSDEEILNILLSSIQNNNNNNNNNIQERTPSSSSPPLLHEKVSRGAL